MKGKLYGIGVGPGDSELMTVKAARLVGEADIIITPKTEKKDGSVALNIAQPYIQDHTEIVPVVFPMVFHAETLSDAWIEAKNIIVSYLEEGKNVVFLTLGDPMFYSTYIYIYRLLENTGINIETIPGVNSFCAIGSKLGYPLVEGNDILSIIPATAPQEKIEQAIALSDNVVVMKVYKNFAEVVDSLEKHGLVDNSVMISRCGLPEEEIISDIKLAKDKKVNYLSTILARRKK